MLMLFRVLTVIAIGLVGCAPDSSGNSASVPLPQLSVEQMFTDPEVRSLAIAAGNGDVSKVQRLVKSVNVNSRGARGATPLFWATQNLDGFVALLENGADPNIVFENGMSVMHWAARMSDVSFLRAALEFGGNPNLYAGARGGTPLFDAILSAHRIHDAIRVLIEAGADVDARQRSSNRALSMGDGNTPLMVAAAIGDFQAVQILLEAGADYRVANDRGDTFLKRVQDKQDAFVVESVEHREYRRVVEWLSEAGAYTQ